MGKVFLVIDGDNFYHLQRRLNISIDPLRLKKFCEKFGEVVDASYYMSLIDDVTEGKDSYMKALVYMGYKLKTSKVKTFTKEDGEQISKSDVDVRLAVDVVLNLDRFDTLVLVSGDGDFSYLLNVVTNRSKGIKVVSSGIFVSRDLRELCGQDYIEVLENKNELIKEQKEDVA
jgi:uncharacterized LabA/DUF88 family protein